MKNDCTSGMIDLDQLVALAREIDYESGDPSHDQYRHFLGYFRDLSSFTEREFLIGIAFAYPWMPRIPRIHRDGYDRAVAAVASAWDGQELGVDDLSALKNVVNHSVVGSSKLLHFVNPELYPILDSWVFLFLCGKDDGLLASPEFYARYAVCCRTVAKRPEFGGLYEVVVQKLGFEPPKLRTLELTMYYGAKCVYRSNDIATP